MPIGSMSPASVYLSEDNWTLITVCRSSDNDVEALHILNLVQLKTSTQLIFPLNLNDICA